MKLCLAALLLPLCLAAQQDAAEERVTAVAPVPAYRPPSGAERVEWVALSTVGPKSLAAGVFSAGFGTALNVPTEYGAHWDGFAKRYGMRLTGIATSNVMEAGLGSVLGEDPRYFRSGRGPLKSRIGHAVKMTFFDRNANGGTMPAYARYVAVTGNNFLSNTWRADSEATTGRASLRIVFGLLGRMGSNLFEEFWPDLTGRRH